MQKIGTSQRFPSHQKEFSKASGHLPSVLSRPKPGRAQYDLDDHQQRHGTRREAHGDCGRGLHTQQEHDGATNLGLVVVFLDFSLFFFSVFFW